MNNMLVYSFVTFPEVKKLENIFGKVFLFRKLKKDFIEFTKLIEDQQPEMIFGIAHNKNHSRIEKLTINRFGKKGKITKNGIDTRKLYIPDYLVNVFKSSEYPTDSFCNWTMYKIAEYLEEKKLPIKLSFVHLRLKELPNLEKIFLDNIKSQL